MAASLDLKNSSLLSAALARWYVSPKRGARTARDETWLKTTPRAIADGLTGGRSERDELVVAQDSSILSFVARCNDLICDVLTVKSGHCIGIELFEMNYSDDRI